MESLRQLAPEAVIKVTREPGHAKELAAKAVDQGYKTIVAAGGDGTLNEVVNGIGTAPVQFGVLPVGTMNVFALELGIPASLPKAWEVIRSGRTRRVDLAQANGQYFIQLAGVGLDAQIVSETDWDLKRNWGPLSYLLTGSLIAGRKPPRLEVIADGGEPVHGCFVLVGNGRYYGGPFEIFKGGRLDDGMLDVYIFQKMSHFDMMRYFHGVLFQSHDRLPDVKTLRVKSLHVACEDPIPVEVDGELLGRTPVVFQVLPGALTVLVPS